MFSVIAFVAFFIGNVFGLHLEVKKNDIQIRNAIEAIDWQLRGSSIDVRADEVVFAVYYTSTTNRPVRWSVDYIPVLEGSTEFSIRSTSNGNIHKSELVAHMPADHLVRRQVICHFNVTSVPSQTSHLSIMFNTSAVTTSVDSGSLGLSYGVESSNSATSIGRTFTVVPLSSGFSYNFGRSFLQYAFLNHSNGDDNMDYISRYLDDSDVGPVSFKKLKGADGQLKTEATLSKVLENTGGDLYMDVYIDVHGNAIYLMELMLVLNSVFTDGAPPDVLQGRFGLSRPYFRQVSGYGNGMMDCACMGIPPAQLNFVKVDNDGSTTPVPFQNEVDFYVDDHYTYLQMVTKNVTTEMNGEYACVGTVGDVTKLRTLNVDLMFPAKFDDKVTKLTRDIDGKITVNISATGNPTPQVKCYENDKSGNDISTNQAYLILHYGLDQHRTGQIIEFDTADNGTAYGPLYRLVCSAWSWPVYATDKVNQWITITV